MMGSDANRWIGVPLVVILVAAFVALRWFGVIG
jgi:hypothetical protein